MKSGPTNRVILSTVTLLVALGSVFPPAAPAGGIGKALMGRILQRDLKRHAVTPARPLTRPRTVHRYTSRAQSKSELKKGLAPNTHMTPKARAGRPLSAHNAQRRYGLPVRPQVRETIHLPAGHPVRHNKALGGAPGRGELTSPKPVPADAIRRVVPLN